MFTMLDVPLLIAVHMESRITPVETTTSEIIMVILLTSGTGSSRGALIEEMTVMLEIPANETSTKIVVVDIIT